MIEVDVQDEMHSQLCKAVMGPSAVAVSFAELLSCLAMRYWRVKMKGP
jgi:hypothetical protein